MFVSRIVVAPLKSHPNRGVRQPLMIPRDSGSNRFEGASCRLLRDVQKDIY